MLPRDLGLPWGREVLAVRRRLEDRVALCLRQALLVPAHPLLPAGLVVQLVLAVREDRFHPAVPRHPAVRWALEALALPEVRPVLAAPTRVGRIPQDTVS